MIQSLYQRDYGEDFYRHFGLVISDEVHRVSAPTFAAAIVKMPAKYRLGLTATPRRGDRMEDVFFWHIGEIEAKGQGAFLDCEVYRIHWEPNVHPVQWNWHGRPILGRLVTALSKDEARTVMGVRLMAKAVRAGRRLLVLSDRVAHTADMKDRLDRELINESYTTGIYCAGGTKKARAQRADAAGCHVTLGTYAMAAEGLDIPDKDTLFLMTPKADIEQATGRIRRIFSGKKDPLVVDIVDHIGFLDRFAQKRLRFYIKDDLRQDKRRWDVKEISRIAS